MSAFVELKTIDGDAIFINANHVVKLNPLIQSEQTDTQPPKHSTVLTFAGGAKKETVEGLARQVADNLDRGLRR